MMDGLKLEPGERVIFRSTRGGPAGYSGWIWLLILFGGSQVCGSLMIIPILASGESKEGFLTTYVMSGVTLLLGLALIGRWILMRIRPSYLITDRRLIARRMFLLPVSIDLDNVGSARRILVQYTRYGTVVSETLTHRVGVGFHSGGFRRFGPMKDPDDFVALLVGVAQKVIDCKALPDADGGLSAAEMRSDILFVKSTLTGGSPRGPMFVGPTKIIGFAEPFFAMKLNQILTIAGSQRSPAEIEASMHSLSQNSEFGRGRAVVMDREGLSLSMSGDQLKVSSGENTVAFDLFPADTERAKKKFVKGTQTGAYR